ncbi:MULTISPECIES: flagellar protein FlaG [unclassified Pseudoalteromonas]|jgi:flagellar protein FlaG|uniref:flagellar protein FlaG n=1 Tax=unclassified Pseudoalteromonas TaxID=194690 RepID=UPI0007315B17|nr:MULTISPECIES: flagellar protein FlaG [unclassified Pseudoalteromonas]KTD98904.1 flagellar biosynthesis protein FlaG [Pseudoalteromonas sp. H71]TMN85848.1 flagellar biosynthesis protein FlaG [Pseudoalteromonas sp. S410]TMN93177.1 flagellar biosynthesis protein FlaG [Pseudoalteromonas sp. S408]TMN99667.1 flagellar biosynthesis protein FlaG [Pseudoalteromonas sp. S407]TMO00443.1 flagellar biosynthesis protein FlaG [Pseudoalteromonas sp. S409]|tara:strand:- start:52 stop:477 length:426 start_codon:yes stop_codon:yes gene_type:complete
MIDLNSTQKTIDGLSIVSSSISKDAVKEEKLEKGTSLTAREAVDLKNAQNIEEQEGKQDKDLFVEVKDNLEKLNEYIPVTSTNLKFEFDDSGDLPIIKVLDKSNDEVIREIPTEEFREIAKALDEFADKLTNKGLLFNKTV